MQSKVQDVTAYIEEALNRLRTLCQQLLTDFEESMDYGGPCYIRSGEVEVVFASQKHFIGVYIFHTDVMNARREQLKGRGISVGKGAICYSKPEHMDYGVVESMLQGTMKSTRPIC